MVLKIDAGYQDLLKNWAAITQTLKVPENDRDLDRLIELSDYLIDNRGPEFEGLLDIVGNLIEKYESRNIPEPQGSPIDAILLLMEQHSLKQKDLVEIGSPGVISEILNGKRELNKRQIKGLSKRFNCSPAVFF
jgi:HTH-type transcriptional regulator / antitoxin HigA